MAILLILFLIMKNDMKPYTATLMLGQMVIIFCIFDFAFLATINGNTMMIKKTDACTNGDHFTLNISFLSRNQWIFQTFIHKAIHTAIESATANFLILNYFIHTMYSPYNEYSGNTHVRVGFTVVFMHLETNLF